MALPRRRHAASDELVVLRASLGRREFGRTDVVTFRLDLEQLPQDDSLLLVVLATPPDDRALAGQPQADRVLRLGLDVPDLRVERAGVRAQERDHTRHRLQGLL